MHFLQSQGKSFEAKVVGGEYADIHQFPQSVFLSAFCQNSNWMCGSSILTQAILLTAAHCLATCTGMFYIDAYAGAADIEQVNVLMPVAKYTIHKNYDPETTFCDIGLALMKTDLVLGSTMQRVIIRRSFTDPDALIAGWGDISDTGEETHRLKLVYQRVQLSKICGKHLKLQYGMMCGSSGNLKDHPASGDSGSALVTKDFQQIGIVSMRAYGQKAMVVYSNVSFFYNWIMGNAAYLYCSRGKKHNT